MGDLVKHTEPRPHPSTVGSDCTWGRLCSTGPASPFLIAYMEWSFRTQICYGSFLIKTLNISHFHSINFKVPNVSYVAWNDQAPVSCQLHLSSHHPHCPHPSHWPSYSFRVADYSASETLHILLVSWTHSSSTPFTASTQLLDLRQNFIFSKQLSLTFSAG